MEISPLPLKGCKFLPMLGSHSHWAVSVLKRVPPTVTLAFVYNGNLRGANKTPITSSFT